MVDFNDWCDAQDDAVGAHTIKTLTARAADLHAGRDAIAAVIPGHFASEERIARNLRRLGRDAAAQYITEKLPTTKAMRSGDLGEILATEYIEEQTAYSAPIKRLRWKDHRNMSMRGDDVIGIQRDNVTGRLRFLKTESKSRVALSLAVVNEARSALDKDNGLPSPHALTFVSERLFESGETALSDAIDDEQLLHGIQPANVRHLLFVLSQNNPAPLLQASMENYGGQISQEGVGLRIAGHVAFVKDVFDLVIANAVND